MREQASAAAARRSWDQQAFESAVTLHERFLRGSGGKRAILQFIDAAGVDCRRRLLNDADFTGANLAGAAFAGSHLERANLYCANLEGGDLRAVNLRRADMRGVRLAGAVLSGAVMDEADMRAAYIAYTGANGAMRTLHHPGPPGASPDAGFGADFTNCAMRGVRLCAANLKGANFTGALLESADFTGARLTDAIFHDTVMSACHAERLNLTSEQLGGCILDPSIAAMRRAAELREMLTRAAEWIESDGRQGAPAVVDRADLRPLGPFLRGRVLTGISAREVVAIHLDFSGSQLQGARFDNADLRGATFDGADLRGASFRGAKLAHARFVGANLSPLALPGGGAHPVSFDGASTERADFSETVLAGRF
jgi:uncharacterized protein YjbI with pentapeptide repeats